MKRFAGAKYVSVRTFRADGTPVDTPVWPGVLGDRLYFGTPAHTHKVERIMANERVEVADCDSRGTVVGAWEPGMARRLTGEEFSPIKKMMDRNRRVTAFVVDIFGRLRGWDYIGFEVVPQPVDEL